MKSPKKKREFADPTSPSDQLPGRKHRSELLGTLVEKSLQHPDPLIAQVMVSACQLWEVADELKSLILKTLRESDDKLAAFNDIEPPLESSLKAHHLAERYVQLAWKLVSSPVANSDSLPSHAIVSSIGEAPL